MDNNIYQSGRSSFNIDNRLVYACGVILYRVQHNRIEMLLIKGKTYLEDLGGKIDASDTDIYETVIREAYEESNGLIKITRERLLDTKPIYTPASKYMIYIIRATNEEEQLVQEQFGTYELHDKIDREIDWFTLDRFYENVKLKSVNYRLVNRNLFDRLNEIKQELTIANDNEDVNYVPEVTSQKNIVYMF